MDLGVFHIRYSSNDTFQLSLLHIAYLNISLLQVTSRKNEELPFAARNENKSKPSQQKLLSL
jgi:hypothetical protein